MWSAHPRRLVLALLACLSACAHAAPTDITVRVLARDAKFIGTSMGGARITLTDVHTGELLATGVTQGTTGQTGLVMHTESDRRDVIVDRDTAGWHVTLDLDEPRLLEVAAHGPLGQPQAANRVTATQWVVPGRHLTGGNGWLLEMPGFAVDVLAPRAHVRLPGGVSEALVEANVVMMCGCPIDPGGLWDANSYEVRALVRVNGRPADDVALAHAGETSRFTGRVPLPEPGVYELTVFAHHPATGNTGLDRTTFFAP